MAGARGRITKKALQEFLSEAQEIVEQLGSDLLRLEDQSKRGRLDPDLVNAAFRAAHSLKGLSGMFGVDRMNTLAHCLEDLLDGLRMGRVQVGSAVLDVLFEGIEALNLIIAEVDKGGDAKGSGSSEARADALEERIRGLLEPDSGAGAEDPLAALDMDPQVLTVLTEYEEHRLRENARIGAVLCWVRASFELMTFDKDLAELTDELKKVGEVISTLPSGEGGTESAIDFDLLVGTERTISDLEDAVAGHNVTIRPVERRDGSMDPASREHARGSPVAGKGDEPSSMPGGPSDARPAKPASASPARARDDEALAERRSPSQVGPFAASIDEEDPDAAEAESASKAASAREDYASLKSVAQTVRVNIARLDYLMTIVGELVLSKTNLQRISDSLKDSLGFTGIAVDLYKEARNLERRLEELQQGVIEVRMVPLGQVFDKLSRMVRKMAREEDKEIKFEVSGGDTELDKLIIEDLSDPLMHLIRNAIDHGIEPPAERIRNGKKPYGTISLTAFQKGNHVTIEVADDGAGMDEQVILDKALNKGLVTASQAMDLSRRDILNLIFVPGFSTRSEVSDLSGRGVGMDVVKTNISNLSGVIDIGSEIGVGSTFGLTLPITLAIIQALVIRTVGSVYAIPLNSVIEILRIEPREIRTVERKEVIDLRGATVPLVRLERVFGLDRSEPYEPNRLFVVVVGLAQNRVGVAVDELVGQHDVVIKSLGRRLGSIRGIAGATDLGDHRTTLVIDVAALIEEVLEGDAHLLAS